MKCGVFGTTGGAVVCSLTAFVLLCFLVAVRAQCERGDEGSCRWSNDETAGAEWITETKAGESYIRLEKCRATSHCGTGTISSPWLPPNTSPNQIVLYFKVYGYSGVYLKLEQKKRNENLPKSLFKKSANYGDSFPEKWSSTTVRIPPTDTAYQLMLKAYSPYADGFIAVKGIAINEPNSIPSSTSSSTSTSTSTTTTPRNVPTSSTTTTTEANDIDFPDVDEESEGNSDGRPQSLEDRGFLTVEDFNFGRTTVVYPELCKY